MLDLTFHAIEYAAYQPYMFNNQPDAYANRVESEVKPERYQSLPPGSPRVSLIQPFASGVARLVERILTAIQRVGAHIFPRASSADTQVRQGSTGTIAEATHATSEEISETIAEAARATPEEISEDHESDSGYETAPEDFSNEIESSSLTHLHNAEKSKPNMKYRQACEDSLRALEGVFSSKEPTGIFEQLADFCECRRVIANLNPAVEFLNDPSTVTYFESLRVLIENSGLERLYLYKEKLERVSGNRDLPDEQRLRFHYMWTVVGGLIEFANSKSATFKSMKSGNPIT